MSYRMEVQLQALVDGKKIIVTEASIRSDLQLNDEEGMDCLPNATIFEELTRMRSRRLKRKDIEVSQPSGPTTNVADKAVYEERDDSLERAATTATGLDTEQDRGGDPRRQETMGDTITQTRSENVSKFSNDPLLARVSYDEASLGDQEDASKQGRKTDDIDKDAEITLVDETQGRYGDDIMFDVSDLAGEEVFIAEQGVPDSKKDDVVSTAIDAAQVSTAAKNVTITPEEITLAQALQDLKAAKPKVKGIVFKEPVESTTIISSQQPSQAKIQDKGKAKMIEPEPMKKLSKKDQLKLDEEVAQRLQAEFDKQERIEREKAKKEAEANIALKETWDDIQAKIKVDCLLAERLQAREQEELTIEERAKLFQQLLEKKRKNFATKRAEEKRNKPPTRAQQRSIMLKRVNTFINFRIELVEGSSKRAGTELEQEATKPPSIVDWKIYKEGKKSYYQIIRVDGSSKMYLVFSHMLKSFDREDLETLYKLVRAKYGSTRLVEDLDLVLYGDLKTMFEPRIEDNVWKNLSDYRVLNWKLYDSCGVHSLRKQNVDIHMLQ
ncbi:hypothetical protein Tco_0700937 [Tanacetum coccineum]